MGVVANAVATVSGLITGVLNFFTDMFLTPPLKATLKHLEETELKTLKGGKSELRVFSIFIHQTSYVRGRVIIICING